VGRLVLSQCPEIRSVPGNVMMSPGFRFQTKIPCKTEKNMKKSIFPFVVLVALSSLPYAICSEKSSADQRFVDEAARGGMMEVEMGQLAQKNGSSDQVRQFGKQMVTDHTRLNDELGNVAKKDGFQVPTDLGAKQRAEIQSLSKLSGKEFDSKYTQLMVKDHTNDLAAFKKAESTTEKPELKKAIAEAIPVIEHHLEMAKKM
jgi:putative membrane protein